MKDRMHNVESLLLQAVHLVFSYFITCCLYSLRVYFKHIEMNMHLIGQKVRCSFIFVESSYTIHHFIFHICIYHMYFTCYSHQIAVKSSQISLSAHTHYCTRWERERGPHTSLLHWPQIGSITAASTKTNWYRYLYVQTLYFYLIYNIIPLPLLN